VVLVGAVCPLVKFKHVDQPDIKRPTPCLIHVLPLLNRRGWKQALCYQSVDFVVLTRVVSTLMHAEYVYTVYV
jgi:hypothetical protein